MKKLTVLCVEHRSGNLQQMKSALERAGYGVVCAANGSEAIAEFSVRDFDGALLEYELPDISGGLLRDWMLRLKPKLPIILITGGEHQFDFLLRFFESFVLRPQQSEAAIAACAQINSGTA